MRISKRIIHFTFLGTMGASLLLTYTNCSSPPSSSGTVSLKPAPLIDPWNAPVGALIEGVTLSDGWIDLREVPDPIYVSGGWTDSVSISNSGRSLYFAYTRYDFAQLMEGIGYNVTGPERVGMTGNNFKNFRADLGSDGWTVNYLPVNNPDPNMNDSSLGSNAGETSYAWAVWNGLDADIYFSNKKPDGSWESGAKVPAPVNSACIDDNPFLVGDISTGMTVFFESTRSDLNGTICGSEHHIYSTTYDPISKTFSPIVKVPGVNGTEPGNDDTQFFVTKDLSTVFWTAVRSNFYGIMTADLVGGVYTNARPVVTPTYVGPFTGKTVFVGEANIVQLSQGWLMYMMCGVARAETGAVHNAELKICVARKPNAVQTKMKINTSFGWSDSPFISRDGNRLYFMYSRYNFAPWITSGGTQQPVLMGPEREGLHRSANAWSESDIYMATKNSDGSWSEPVNLGFNGDYGDASGMEINNGNTFVWLQGNGLVNDIVMATKNSDGTWGAPVNFGPGINNHASGVIQDNPHVSPDGNALWFVSSRPGGIGAKDIWFSFFSNGSWSNPINWGPPVNTNGDEDQPWISPASNDVYWNSPSGLMHCLSNGTTCSAAPVTVTIPGCSYVAEASLPDNGQSIYFGCGDPSTGKVKIMYSIKQPSGTWGPATSVD